MPLTPPQLSDCDIQVENLGDNWWYVKFLYGDIEQLVGKITVEGDRITFYQNPPNPFGYSLRQRINEENQEQRILEKMKEGS